MANADRVEQQQAEDFLYLVTDLSSQEHDDDPGVLYDVWSVSETEGLVRVGSRESSIEECVDAQDEWIATTDRIAFITPHIDARFAPQFLRSLQIIAEQLETYEKRGLADQMAGLRYSECVKQKPKRKKQKAAAAEG